MGVTQTRSRLRKIGLGLLVLVLTLGPAIAHEFYPGEHVAVLYAIPIVIAGQVFSPGVALVFIALALIGHTYDSINDQASYLLWGTQAVVLLIVAYLAIRGKEQERAEARLNVQLREERQEREQFTGAVIHEMRNVLTIILGYANVLTKQEEWRSPAEQRALESIESQSHRLDRLVQDLQTVSRIERGVFEMQPEACDLNKVAQKVVEDDRRLTDRHQLILTLNGSSLVGMWDCGRLQQVLDNLVRNAIRYSPNGGTIEVELMKVDGMARAMVRDQGIGISEADLDKLFKPYVRLKPEVSREGLGLGLYISQQIIENHGGRIWAESTVGKGSRFTFEIPVGEATKEG